MSTRKQISIIDFVTDPQLLGLSISSLKKRYCEQSMDYHC